jgi:hypothetical protein
VLGRLVASAHFEMQPIPKDRQQAAWEISRGYGEGTEGRIGLVIVVKIEFFKTNETETQNGFVEVYKYDQEQNRRARHGGER